jgi:Cell division septal protein
MAKVDRTKKRVKIKYRKVFAFLFVLFLLFIMAKIFLSFKITNIYISGNVYLEEQEIIELANIQNYPKIIDTLPYKITKKLKKHHLIKKAKVKHKGLTKLNIEIKESKILFYNSITKKTVLESSKVVNETYDCPVLLNYVPDKKYKEFIVKMEKIDLNILSKISEIKYDPNDKDDSRFLLSMNDGNYVYLTLDRFDTINKYLNIMVEISTKFDNKKGILYLDSGKYFKVLE